MPRDYAKYKVVKRSPKKKWRRAGSIFAIAMVLCFVGGGYGVYRYQKHDLVANTQEMSIVWGEVVAKFHRKKARSLAVTKNKTESQQDEGVHFNFYTELPNMQVSPAAVDENPAPKPLIKEAINDDADQEPAVINGNNSQYTLQMGVFSDVNTASQSRLSLLLGGFESEIIKTTENGSSFYIVQQGPFADINHAKMAQKKLMSKGVESTVKKTYL